ncbi:transposase domain-containing protein [Pseudomonas wenzhouensis]|nr:transposase domain-containing protein [Pseudomonas wenzhouensis]UFQ99170.1 transposase domain-containing protein [Pseudomonas wenzhouensis]
MFSPKSERSPEDTDSPQLAMFNEAEELIEALSAAPAEAEAEAEAEEVVAPVKRRGKRKPLPANLPRVEVIHDLPEHELTCACGACKQLIGEETSEQLEIIPMQVRVIRHIGKTYACKACEAAPITADHCRNRAENAIRPFVIGRKNWLFSDTPKGVTASAQIYSLIETAKANGQEPYAWLCHILERLPTAQNVEEYEALLPWNCSLASSAPAS